MTNCHQLKLRAEDGKYRLTDVCNIEGMFRIIQSIPSKDARNSLEQQLGKSIITSDNKLNYQYIDNIDEKLIENKKIKKDT